MSLEKGDLNVKQTIAIGFLALALVGCNKNETSAANSPVTPAAPAPVAAPSGDLNGKIVETMNSGGYTYVKLQTAQGEVWAAIPQTEVKTGADISLNSQMTMPNFESKSLNRTFDKIVFATVAGAAGNPHANMPAGNMPAANTPSEHMSGGTAEAAISVPKAEGGRTIAETWAARKELANKQVVIRGQVVKSLSGIMGKNWMHLRDGSGSAEKHDNDITVTSDGSAKVGDIVTVTGTLRVDKDFGAGYMYEAIVEDAKVTK